MICSEITISTTINILIFIALYIITASLSYTIDIPQYINSTYYDTDETQHIISQEINPNYPGEEKIRIAKTIYLSIPQGQATEISNIDIQNIGNINLYQLPIYSMPLVTSINMIGIYLFFRKELK